MLFDHSVHHSTVSVLLRYSVRDGNERSERPLTLQGKRMRFPCHSGLRPAQPAIGAVLLLSGFAGGAAKSAATPLFGFGRSFLDGLTSLSPTSIAKSRVAALRAAPGATPPTASFGLLTLSRRCAAGRGPGGFHGSRCAFAVLSPCGPPRARIACAILRNFARRGAQDCAAAMRTLSVHFCAPLRAVECACRLRC